MTILMVTGVGTEVGWHNGILGVHHESKGKAIKCHVSNSLPQ